MLLGVTVLLVLPVLIHCSLKIHARRSQCTRLHAAHRGAELLIIRTQQFVITLAILDTGQALSRFSFWLLPIEGLPFKVFWALSNHLFWVAVAILCDFYGFRLVSRVLQPLEIALKGATQSPAVRFYRSVNFWLVHGFPLVLQLLVHATTIVSCVLNKMWLKMIVVIFIAFFMQIWAFFLWYFSITLKNATQKVIKTANRVVGHGEPTQLKSHFLQIGAVTLVGEIVLGVGGWFYMKDIRFSTPFWPFQDQFPGFSTPNITNLTNISASSRALPQVEHYLEFAVSMSDLSHFFLSFMLVFMWLSHLTKTNLFAKSVPEGKRNVRTGNISRGVSRGGSSSSQGGSPVVLLRHVGDQRSGMSPHGSSGARMSPNGTPGVPDRYLGTM